MTEKKRANVFHYAEAQKKVSVTFARINSGIVKIISDLSCSDKLNKYKLLKKTLIFKDSQKAIGKIFKPFKIPIYIQ